MLRRISGNVQSEAAFDRGLWIETAVVVVTHLCEVRHSLGEVPWRIFIHDTTQLRHVRVVHCTSSRRPCLSHGCDPSIEEALALRCISACYFLRPRRVGQFRVAAQLLHDFIVLLLLVAQLALGPRGR